MLHKILTIVLFVVVIFVTYSVLAYVSVYITASKMAQNQEYLACGCGCCGGVEPDYQCLYRDKGDSLQSIIKNDLLTSRGSFCSVVGCSRGTVYQYCN